MGTKSAATAQLDAILSKAGGKKKAKGGKKGRKIGRYGKSPSCLRYRGEMRWIANRLRRMESHLRRYPADSQAARLLAEFRAQ